MPWRKYLLIMLTKKSPIFKLFTSPISLLYFPSIFCLLFPFVSSPTRSSQHFVLFEARGSCGSQSAAQRVTRVCHVSRVLACVVTHLMLSRECYSFFPRILERNYLLWRSRNQSSEETPTVCSPASFIMRRGAPCIHYILVPWGEDGAVCPGTPHKDPQLTKNIS